MGHRFAPMGSLNCDFTNVNNTAGLIPSSNSIAIGSLSR